MNSSNDMLGIQFDNDSLFMVHLYKRAEELQVCDWTSVFLEEGTVSDGVIVKTKGVARKIKNFMKKQKMSKPNAIMAPPHSAVRLTLSQIAAQDDELLYQLIEERVDEYGLFANEEIVCDFCLAQERFQLAGKKTVLQAFIRRDVSDSLLKVARLARLNLIAIEPAPMACMRLIGDKLSSEGNEVSMILSLDGRSGAVCVFKNGLLQHCQNLSLGVTDIIQDHQLARELQEQMKSVFVFSRSAADSKRPVLRIAASCGLDELSQIAEIIKEGPDDVSVEYINPQAVREQVGGGDSQNKELPLIACGLAMTEQDLPGFNSSLNLVSQESVAMHKTKRQLLSLAQAAVVIVVLSVAAIYPLKMRAQARETSTTLLAEKTKDSVLLVQKTTGIAKEIASLTEKRAVYDQAVQRLSDAQWVKILQATSEAVPEDVRIVQIVVTKSAEFEVTGEALQESGISRFVSNLQSKNLFESVRIEEIEFDHTEEEVPVVNYKIICKKRTMETGR